MPFALTSGRQRLRPVFAIGASVVLAAASLVGCTSQAGRHGSTSSEPPLGYRSVPSFLPTASAPVDQVTTASPAHPQLAVQGVGVRVKLPTGGVLATVTGPHVPPFVAPPPPAVTATFDVSLADATGSIPLRVADFSITDQLGRTFHPTLVTHEKPPPSTLSGHRAVTFQVTAAMPTGEGRIYWSPTGGAAVVGWDFIVEND